MKRVTHYSSPENRWGKSHTPKRYLQPPFFGKSGNYVAEYDGSFR